MTLIIENKNGRSCQQNLPKTMHTSIKVVMRLNATYVPIVEPCHNNVPDMQVKYFE